VKAKINCASYLPEQANDKGLLNSAL